MSGKRKYMGKEAERSVKTFCLLFCLLTFLVLTGADVARDGNYRFISSSTLYTLEDDSRWKSDEAWNRQLRTSLSRTGDREARWVYIFRQ